MLREYGIAEAELMAMPWRLLLDRIAGLSAQSVWLPLWLDEKPPDYVSPDDVDDVLENL